MREFLRQSQYLKSNQHRWLVTGCAGFIGSNLTEFLLLHNQIVIGVDNFSTGKQENLDDIKKCVGKSWSNFYFSQGDIVDPEICKNALDGVDYVLHQAALGSVPRSIKDPIISNNSNVTGFLNLIWQAKESGVKKFVFASSSSVYGDDKNLPKVEETVGNPLSPYAVTKKVNELYANVFFRTYDFPIVGIRYFNVFGKRQDPNGAYAAVIPRWVKAMAGKEGVVIFGDGETSRDFCYIKNVIEMNILAALSENESSYGEVFNCAYADRTTLNDLFKLIKDGLVNSYPHLSNFEAEYQDFRAGDITHSHACIDKANHFFGYEPEYSISKGLTEALTWYQDNI